VHHVPPESHIQRADARTTPHYSASGVISSDFAQKPELDWGDEPAVGDAGSYFYDKGLRGALRERV